MCRHLAWLGAPLTLGELIVDPPHSLFQQSWQPRAGHGITAVGTLVSSDALSIDDTVWAILDSV